MGNGRMGDASRLVHAARRGWGRATSGVRARHAGVVSFAAVLDGKHLWLALARLPPANVKLELGNRHGWTEIPSRFANARSVGGVPVLEVRAPLDELLPATGERFRLRLTVDGAAVKTTLDPLLGAEGPAQIRPTPDRRWRYELGRHRNQLSVIRHPEAAASEVVDMRTHGEDLVLRCTSSTAEHDLLLLDGDDDMTPAVREDWQDGVLTSRIPTGELGLTLGARRLLAVGSPGAWRLVMRARNDLRDPDGSVVLPIVEDPSAQFPGTGFSYLPDGSLALTRRLR